ncbi:MULTISPECIES: putative leader peptide [unclassified Streptomyces]
MNAVRPHLTRRRYVDLARVCSACCRRCH